MDILTPDLVAGMVAGGGSTRVDVNVSPRFKVGDEIVVRNINPTGHTRLPRYLHSRRGRIERDHGVFILPDAHTRLPRYLHSRRGRIERDHGVFILPDAHAHGQGEKPQHVYSVRFSSSELWGREGSPKDSCNVDVFDDYMDPV